MATPSVAKVSIVIPCLNSEKTISRCLDSLFGQDFIGIKEIIVVDNGSDDRTNEIVSRYDVKVIECKNRGRSCARNAGAQSSSHQILVFLDSDVVLEPNWLRTVINKFENPLLVAGTSAISLAGDGTSLLHQYRKQYHAARNCADDMSQKLDFFTPFVLNSAAMAVRKSAFLKAGCFDEKLARFEDTDLSYRLFFSGGHFFSTTQTTAHVYYLNGWRGYFLRNFEEGKSEVVLFKKWKELRTFKATLENVGVKFKLVSKLSFGVSLLHLILLLSRITANVFSILFLAYPNRAVMFPVSNNNFHQFYKLKSLDGRWFELSPLTRIVVLDEFEYWMHPRMSYSTEVSVRSQLSLSNIHRNSGETVSLNDIDFLLKRKLISFSPTSKQVADFLP